MSGPASQPLVSVLIPAFNCAPWIRAAVESALAQTWRRLEVLVVDDGSTDETPDILAGMVPQGVRVIRQANRGASAARNHALREAAGDWIQFLDGDDLLHPEKIARQMARASGLGPEFLYTAEWGRFVRVPDEAQFNPSILLQDSDPVPWLRAKYEHNEMVQPGAWLVHRSLIERSGPWDERISLNDDGEFFDRLVLRSRGVRHVEGAKAYYRAHRGGSLSGRTSYQAAASALLSMDLGSARLLEVEDSPETRRACALQYRRFAIQFLPLHSAIANCADRRAEDLGGADVEVPGGRVVRILGSLVGWRIARRVQYLVHRIAWILGYLSTRRN